MIDQNKSPFLAPQSLFRVHLVLTVMGATLTTPSKVVMSKGTVMPNQVALPPSTACAHGQGVSTEAGTFCTVVRSRMHLKWPWAQLLLHHQLRLLVHGREAELMVPLISTPCWALSMDTWLLQRVNKRC